jgi:tetratricopeptide (TPR) repeat protein
VARPASFRNARRFPSLCAVAWLSAAQALGCLSVAHAQARDAHSARAAHERTPAAYARAVEAAVDAYNRDDFVTARHYFARAHELRPSARTWRGLGTTAFELKFFEDAVRELTFALEDRRSALTNDMRTDTELTLRVAQRRLAERREPSAAREQAALSGKSATAVAAALPRAREPDVASAGLGGQRIVALALAGSALVSVGVGVVFGLRSIAKGRERDRSCPDAHAACASTSAIHAAQDALTAGDISTAAWLVGAAALGGGITLWLTGAPAAQEQPQRSGLTHVVIGPAAVSLSGAF